MTRHDLVRRRRRNNIHRDVFDPSSSDNDDDDDNEAVLDSAYYSTCSQSIGTVFEMSTAGLMLGEKRPAPSSTARFASHYDMASIHIYSITSIVQATLVISIDGGMLIAN